MIEMKMALVLLTLILCVLSLIMSGIAIIMVLALKNSTHRVEWKPFPLDDEGFMDGKELNKQMNKRHEENEFDQI
jgi:hypothetical protein